VPDIRIADFSGGWLPGDDPINGRKNGLLQMDNLELDSNGALQLQGGCVVKNSGFPSNAHTMYSRLINGARHDYAGLADGSVYRDSSSIITGGDSTNTAFGTAFNFTLIASGNQRKKDTGAALVDLGIAPAAAAPTLSYSYSNAPYSILGDVSSDTVTPIGTSAVIGGTYLQMTADANGQWAVQTYGGTGDPHNLNSFTGPGGDVGYATDDDFIFLTGYTPIVAGRSLNLDVLLVNGNVAGDVVSDYYSYQIGELSAVTFSSVTGTFSWKMRRKDFIRVGGGAQNWSTCYGFRISYSGGVASEVVNLLGNGSSSPVILMFGGSDAQNGQYQYLQVNCNNTGSYIGKSIGGPLSIVVDPDMTQVLVKPYIVGIDSQVNEIWIFRRGGLLDQWYRVKVILAAGFAAAAASGVYDPLGDQLALELNIKLNINLSSIASGSISDKIFEILGPINGRWYFFTTNFMYPSDINNPDQVDTTIGVRICGSSSELFMWARQINDTTVLVGTSIDVYSLSGTFATFPDNTIDIYYRPLKCKYPPLTCDAEVWGGAVYYLANDGWRLIDSGGGNPSLVSPTLDRLYRGETLEGYLPPNLKILPRSVRFPIVIAQNKMFCFVYGTNPPRIEIYDFIRQYWRCSNYILGEVTAAVHTQDGQVLAFYGTDKKTREVNVQSSHLIDGATNQTILLKSMVFDNSAPFNRKDSSTLKMRIKNTGTLNPYLTVDNNGVVTYTATIGNHSIVSESSQDISTIAAVALVKTYQFGIAPSTVSAFILDEVLIDFDQRPEQRTFIRIQGQNFGTTARKRIATIPFQLDSLGGSVTINSILDGNLVYSPSFSSNRKTSLNIEFPLSGGNLPIARDYEFTLHSTNLFEFFGFEEPKIVELYPQPCNGYVIPTTNFGTAARKRVRTWPFILSGAGALSFTPIVDGVAMPAASTSFSLTAEKATYRYYFKTDVFGVDYSGYFSGADFEVSDIMQPEIVQILPIAKRFDQVGPEEFFRYGKIKQMELRVLPVGGTSIPYTIYFNDTTSRTAGFTVVDGKEATYFLMMPKGTSGNIVRIELGPTSFDFHRFYTRLQVAESGNDTDLKWINL